MLEENSRELLEAYMINSAIDVYASLGNKEFKYAYYSDPIDGRLARINCETRQIEYKPFSSDKDG